MITESLLGMATAYFLARQFVFPASGQRIVSEAKRFAIVNLFSLVLVWSISVGLARHFLPSALLGTATMSPISSASPRLRSSATSAIARTRLQGSEPLSRTNLIRRRIPLDSLPCARISTLALRLVRARGWRKRRLYKWLTRRLTSGPSRAVWVPSAGHEPTERASEQHPAFSQQRLAHLPHGRRPKRRIFSPTLSWAANPCLD